MSRSTGKTRRLLLTAEIDRDDIGAVICPFNVFAYRLFRPVVIGMFGWRRGHVGDGRLELQSLSLRLI